MKSELIPKAYGTKIVTWGVPMRFWDRSLNLMWPNRIEFKFYRADGIVFRDGYCEHTVKPDYTRLDYIQSVLRVDLSISEYVLKK